MWKNMKFDYTTKWYRHKPESVLENETHKILWHFEMQTDHLIPARRTLLSQQTIGLKPKKVKNEEISET